MSGSHATALRGSELPQAKLTDALVRQMRAEYVYCSKTHGAPALARKYGVSRTAARDMLDRKTWFHVR